MNSLLSLLSDKDDAWHLFVASSNRTAYFVTADVSNVIKYENVINIIYGVEALLPSFFDYCGRETT